MRFSFSLALSVAVLLIVGLGVQGAGAQTNHSNKSVAKAGAAVVTAAAPVSYHEQVETYLKSTCGSCHSSDKHSSGFVVETPESLFKGGTKTGAKVIVPGKASESLLIAYLKGAKQPRMPLNQAPAPAEQIKAIEDWINQGAKIDAVKLGWPYLPPVAHAVPTVKNTGWVRNPIDNFILAKLEAKGLKPAPPADRVALLRRVYADLIGEPPTPSEAQAFLDDKAPDAYEKVVDRLLADPRYGERWGRHWLDLVRYADSDGFEQDGDRPRAWRYRDYVIKAFNEDKPYDRFLKEQIAGDELFPKDPDAIVATGYARLASWDALSTDHPQRWQDYLNDVTDTTGSVMLGLTVGCARCHNHKYDRITQADYYRMQSFFVQTRWTETKLPGEDPYAKQVADKREKLQALQQQERDLREQYRAQAMAEKQKHVKPGEKVEINDGDIEKEFKQKDRDAWNHLHDQMRELESQIAPYNGMADVVSDEGKTAPVEHLLLRGNLLTPGPEVQPGFMASLCGGEEKPVAITPPATGNSTGRRAALAEWIAGKDNPMTARVIVNRLWQHHFGRGIVASPSDFGRNGDKATHPELLDWLALRLMDDGWSLKKIHRLMLLSATYQQSTKLDSTAAKADPLNTLLWRMNRIRLEGEPLRDSILAISGRLNPQMGGPGIFPHVSDEVLSTGSTHKWGNSPEDQGLRRTVYVFQRRSLVLPIVEAFDGPDTSNTCPRRGVTTIAPQSLALFNGDFSRTECRYFAQRVIKEAGDDTEKQIDRAYQIALVRLPTPAQLTLAKTFIEKQTELHRGGATQAVSNDLKAAQAAHLAALSELCHVLINTNEFIYLD